MATDRTALTELGTAVGIMWSADDLRRIDLARATIPGIADDAWKPLVLRARAPGSADGARLRRALANGHAFRQEVLRGVAPHHVEWTGGTRNVWVSDIPGDVVVNEVYFVQAKYDGSRCLLNTAPSALFDDLLVQDGVRGRPSWFDEVAPGAHQAFYLASARQAESLDLPPHVTDLTGAHRRSLKGHFRSGRDETGEERAAYRRLCEAVSAGTADRWARRLDGATAAQRTQMLFRMLRIAGGRYWLLGDGRDGPVRLRVDDTRTWRRRFELRAFDIRAAAAGQPQVDWGAHVRDRATGADHVVDGFCEIRWSHGRLSGNPECKVQVLTPLAQVPGYSPMASATLQPQLGLAGMSG